MRFGKVHISVLLALLIVGIGGCGILPVTLNSSDTQWSTLDSNTKLSLINSEFKNVSYDGPITAHSIIPYVDHLSQDSNPSSSLPIKSDIDICLGSSIALQEQNSLTNSEINNTSPAKELSQLKQFMYSSSGGKMLQRLNDTSDLQDLHKNLQQLTAQLAVHKPAAHSTKSQITPTVPSNNGDVVYLNTLNSIMTSTSEDVQNINQDLQTVQSGSGEMSNQDLAGELQTDVQEYENDIGKLQSTNPTSYSDDQQLVIGSLKQISNDMASMQQAANSSDQSGMDTADQQIQSDYSNLQALYTTDFTRMQQQGIQPLWNPALYGSGN